ncbi:DUF2782 domain-containing protein [uncultured Nitrosomonas sp.]|uniref:DUF2782 domain-containing protein n=1 Tax=uncultured Nitrosomonas sp. TaxID=156424 RepID=UPI0025D9C0AC|nr:DUF2782 domain-containing protein [uncultured Nitrosomonas sp.]
MYLYRLILIVSLCLILPVIAESEHSQQSKKTKHPDNLIPLPEVPELPPEADYPPLPEIPIDPELETEVTIIKRGQDTIEEHRVNGELLMIKVIPRIGPPYYLKKNPIRSHHDHAGEAGIDVNPPMWEILRF